MDSGFADRLAVRFWIKDVVIFWDVGSSFVGEDFGDRSARFLERLELEGRTHAD